MTRYKTLNDLPDIQGKVILLRADLNVPTNNGKVSDLTRILRIKPTIDDLISRGATIKILSHFGRPKGKILPEYSLCFLTPILSDQWDHPVGFETESTQITLLENTRFHAGEEQNSQDLAKTWSEGADIYINDAFSVSHRAHASIEAITHHLPSYAGHLMIQELQALEKALEEPQKPVTALIGGAKISTKLDLLNNLIKKVDYLVLGGGMANTFVCAQDVDVGSSLCEYNMLETARSIMNNAEKANCKIILPADFIVAEEFKSNAPHEIVGVNDIAKNKMALDIGPNSIKNIKTIINQSKTVVWNGPMGAFELEPFDQATVQIAEHVAQKTKNGDLVSIAGGGDTVSALAHAGVEDKLTYLSSAGGAFLEWLEGKTLPGVAALCR